MCQLLIFIGFEPHYVYWEMGQAEFELQFMTAIKNLYRLQQIQSSTFMSSVGSFLVKKGERTVLEELRDDMLEIDEILGIEYEDITAEPKEEQTDVVADLWAQMQNAKRRR